IRRVEGAELDKFARQPLDASDRPVRVHDLDALPAIALICFEDRPDLDVDTGLLADLSRQRLFQPLTRREEPTQESPLRRAKAMARQDHVAVCGREESIALGVVRRVKRLLTEPSLREDPTLLPIDP